MKDSQGACVQCPTGKSTTKTSGAVSQAECDIGKFLLNYDTGTGDPAPDFRIFIFFPFVIIMTQAQKCTTIND